MKWIMRSKLIRENAEWFYDDQVKEHEQENLNE